MKRKMIVSIAQLTGGQRERILAAAERHGFEALFLDREEDALQALDGAEILFSQSAALARHAPSLRWQCTPSAGVDHFLAPGTFAGPEVLLSNSSGAYGVTIAEHVIMVTLEILRRQQDYTEITARREWRRDLPVRSIRGSRILMMGTGDIGQEAALRLRAFSPASLLGLNRSGRNPAQRFDRILLPEELEEVLPETDLLILSLPDTPETRGVLDQKRLALLPDGAVIVNAGRGSAIHQGALEKELRAGRLSAALDVFEKEPLPQQDPMWDCPNLLLTPHVAGNMTLPYTLERIVELFLEDFENYCAGRPLCRAVNPQKGY